MEESLLADIKQEEKLLVEDEEETETPVDSPTETKPEEDPLSSEGGKPKEESEAKVQTEENVPFHKHPRWKELQEELHTKEDRIGELEKKIGEISPKLKEIEEKERPIPSWFAETFGENQELWGKYQSHEKEERQAIKEEIYAEQEQIQRQHQESTQKWNSWVIDQVSGLESEGLKFDRNELMKTLVDYKPTDEQGNLDFHKGYEILEKIKLAESVGKSKATDEKKRVASQTMEAGKGEGSPKDYKTHKDFIGKDWTDVAF